MIGCVESKTRNHIIDEAWFVRCILNKQAGLVVVFRDKNHPDMIPRITMVIGTSFSVKNMNIGTDCGGITHNIDEPIIIDIVDITIIGITVVVASHEVNSGKWWSGPQIINSENRME